VKKTTSEWAFQDGRRTKILGLCLFSGLRRRVNEICDLLVFDAP